MQNRTERFGRSIPCGRFVVQRALSVLDSRAIDLPVAGYGILIPFMNGRVHHFLLVALFAVAQLVAQPFVSASWCADALAMGEGQCCCSVDAAPTGCSGCCGSQESSNGEPSDSEGYESNCQCLVSPPAPMVPERSQPAAAECADAQAAVQPEANPLYASVWPSLAVRAARPPNAPPRLRCKASRVFTQVFRL